MAWIVGTANNAEIELMKKYGTVEIVTPAEEIGFFGGLRDQDDTDKMIKFYMDVDAVDIVMSQYTD